MPRPLASLTMKAEPVSWIFQGVRRGKGPLRLWSSTSPTPLTCAIPVQIRGETGIAVYGGAVLRTLISSLGGWLGGRSRLTAPIGAIRRMRRYPPPIQKVHAAALRMKGRFACNRNVNCAMQ